MTNKVLVIDDEPMSRALLRLTMQQAGLQVVEADDGMSALMLINQYKPDLITMDVMMPTLDGLALCRYIRQQPALSDVPIIIVSAKGQMGAIKAGLAAGATQYLTKPFSRKELLQTITSLLLKVDD